MHISSAGWAVDLVWAIDFDVDLLMSNSTRSLSIRTRVNMGVAVWCKSRFTNHNAVKFSAVVNA